MTNTLIPVRTALCRALEHSSGSNTGHVPIPTTVESESSVEIEWQFGTCSYCGESISRFRMLHGGTWFDHWGHLDDASYG